MGKVFNCFINFRYSQVKEGDREGRPYKSRNKFQTNKTPDYHSEPDEVGAKNLIPRCLKNGSVYSKKYPQEIAKSQNQVIYRLYNL